MKRFLGPSKVMAMMNYGNIKMKQLRVFNRYMKEGTGRKFMCNEKDTKKIDKHKVIDFCNFEEKINRVVISYRHKNVNKDVSNFSLDENNFPNHSKVKHVLLKFYT